MSASIIDDITGGPVGTRLTDREVEILGKAWNCLKTAPEVSFNMTIYAGPARTDD